MSKQCPGKYHGSGVKIIKDSEKYCTVCQQYKTLRNKKIKEGIVGGIVAVGSIVLSLFIIKKEKK